MKKIIIWHNEAIYGDPHHIALNLEMARELEKIESITYPEYAKMCKRMGVSAMREETFISKYENINV
jgi:hypothetical protein